MTHLASRLVFAALAPALVALPSVARADEASASTVAPMAPVTPRAPVPDESGGYPRVGGHLGMALPVVTVGKETTVVGGDFVTLGITPGITIHLDEKWAIDFEFIAMNEVKNTPAATTFVVDPGVIRKFESFSAGLRVATQVGAPTNVGLVPIIVIPFKISDKISYFIEGDLPLFLRDTVVAGAPGAPPTTEMQPSATFLFQTGVGF